MTVSHRVPYAWTCPACRGRQQSAVWAVVHGRERPDVLAGGVLAPGFVQVVCPRCETGSPIDDQPLLLVRPGDDLPLLVGTTWADLASEDPSPALTDLYANLQLATASQRLGIYPPVVALPRALLAVVVARVPDDDAEDPDLACGQVAGRWSTFHATVYRIFLGDVRGSARIRAVRKLLQQAWSSAPEHLLQFVREHPDLSSADVIAAVADDLLAGPPPGESAAPLTARLRLVQSLAAGIASSDAVDVYLRTMAVWFAEDLVPRVDGLVATLKMNPSSVDLIPQAREALAFAISLGDTDLEADAGCDLGVRLLNLPGNQGTEEAARHLDRAFELTADDASHWPAVAGNLANAVLRRASGDPNENWVRARELLERACAADPKADPRAWAVNHTNLGLLLSERPGGSNVDDLAAAIEFTRMGASQRSPEADLVDWAYSQLNLGFLHRRRGRPGDNVVAESLFDEAVERLTPASNRRLWAFAQLNRGELLTGTGSAQSTARALEAARVGLEAAPRLEDPELTARLLWLTAQNTVVPEQALEARNRALALLVPELQPELFLRLGSEVTEATTANGDWDAAAAVYEQVLTAFDALFDAQLTAQGRRRTVEQWPRLSRWAAYALAQAGRHERAVQVIEQGRARELALSLSRGTVELDGLRRLDPALARRYEDSRRGYAITVLKANRLQEAPAARVLSAAAADLQETVGLVRAVPGHGQFLRPPRPADLLEATGGLPVAYLVTTPAGSCVLTLRTGDDGKPETAAVQVPEVNGRGVAGLVLADTDSQLPGIALAPDRQGRQHALTRLGELTPLVEPVVALLRLDASETIVVVPTGLLGMVPLHAVPVAGRVLDDEGEIRMAPSVAVYGACRRRAGLVKTTHLVGVADTNALRPLPASRVELDFVEDLFGQFERPSTRTGESASREWLLSAAATASHLHLACHGSSSLQTRFGGELELADGTLGMTDLHQNQLLNLRLVVASACESGHYDMALSPDEFLGLPGGFMQAGAACVVASLWSVDDRASAILMMRFYELLDPALDSAAQAPVTALRAARSWMRGLTPRAVGDFRHKHSAIFGAPNEILDKSLASHLASVNSWAAFAANGC